MLWPLVWPLTGLCAPAPLKFLYRNRFGYQRLEMAVRESFTGQYNGFKSHSTAPSYVTASYEETIEALNKLQSGPRLVQTPNGRQASKLNDSLKYLQRCGVRLDTFEAQVPVIHVSGTKGKGSTCAICESILRSHGYRTGLYTSPHLRCVRERIRINGVPLSTADFTKYFWEVHHRLSSNKEHETDMPMYFRFLTMMAFYVFMAEKVDVAIIEVGIGGEVDCTNILRKTPIVGITSLGLDHTQLLGDTIEEIAWQKAGIIKPGSIALTVANHKPSALKVIRERAEEKKAELRLVPDIETYPLDVSELPFTHRLNSSLAIQLAHSWMKWRQGESKSDLIKMSTSLDKNTLNGILNCSWSGRFHTVHRGRHTYYLDGAHTIESTKLCAEWFNSIAPKDEKRILVFNTTQGRNPAKLLNAFVDCDIDLALFCSNNLSTNSNKIPQDIINKNVTSYDAEKVVKHNQEVWQSMRTVGSEGSRTFFSVEETVKFIDAVYERHHILVTGSIHLVGAILTIIQPDSR